MNLPKTCELLDLNYTIAAEFLKKYEYPHEALGEIKNIIKEISKTLPADEYDEVEEGVFIAKDAKIHKSAVIKGPTIIGHGTEVRPSAFIRGSALIGNGAVIGNSTEIKNAIIFDGAQLPHYNYVGDSILGYRAHLGAGAIISNFRLDHQNIKIHNKDEVIETGLRKFGAILGDFAEVGCNGVVYPGTVIGRGTLVYPLTSARGVIPENSIVKNNGNIVKKF